ncbi:MAG: hypothetical protein K5840_07375 [Eubacterium sp.]|nr:hypothetical protein [Eubacterium sp.]
MNPCLGIDLNDKYVQISYMDSTMEEPSTLSPSPDSKVYLIPYDIARTADGRWVIGYEASRMIKEDSESLSFKDNDIYASALRGEKLTLEGVATDARIPFSIFLQNLCTLGRVTYGIDKVSRIVITVPVVSREVLFLFNSIEKDLPAGEVMLRDHKESFACFALSQPVNIWRNGVVLFDFDGVDMSVLYLQRNERVRPVVAVVKEDRIPGFGKKLFSKKPETLDRDFNEAARGVFEKFGAGAVYLVGEGFDGDWMNESIKTLCEGRRVFKGQNLYTKGACICSSYLDGREKDFVYLGDSKTGANLCMNVTDRGNPRSFVLLSAGENWYEAEGSAEVILEEGNTLDFMLISPDGKDTRREKIELDGLPVRPPRTGRVSIDARALSERRFTLSIKDLGFGEFYPTSGMEWDFEITL